MNDDECIETLVGAMTALGLAKSDTLTATLFHTFPSGITWKAMDKGWGEAEVQEETLQYVKDKLGID